MFFCAASRGETIRTFCTFVGVKHEVPLAADNITSQEARDQGWLGMDEMGC
jgi:hypothetical protein